MAKAKKMELDASALEGDVDAGEATRADETVDTGETPVAPESRMEEAATLPTPDSPLPAPAAEAAKAEVDPKAARLAELLVSRQERDLMSAGLDRLIDAIDAHDEGRHGRDVEILSLRTQLPAEVETLEPAEEDPALRIAQIERMLSEIGDPYAYRRGLGAKRGQVIERRQKFLEHSQYLEGNLETEIEACRAPESRNVDRKNALEAELAKLRGR